MFVEKFDCEDHLCEEKFGVYQLKALILLQVIE